MELIRSAVVLEPPDGGVAEPGMVLTVRYDGNGSTETFLMVDRQEAAQAGLEVWTRPERGTRPADATVGPRPYPRTKDQDQNYKAVVQTVPATPIKIQVGAGRTATMMYRATIQEHNDMDARQVEQPSDGGALC